MRRLVLFVAIWSSSPAFAQSLEVTPLVSYTTPAAIDKKAPGILDLTINRSFTWGAEATYFVSPRVGLEVLWTYQSSGLSMTTVSGTAELFSMNAHQFHGNVVYQFGEATTRVRPFLFFGLGATSFSAEALERETKASWTLGGGLKWFLQPHIGIKMQGRYKPTELRDSSASVCDPFGFCQETLQPFELAAGVVFRF
jgi:outer membrane protein W